MKTMKGSKRYKLPVVKYVDHKNIMYSTGKIANNVVITLYGDRWILDLPW